MSRNKAVLLILLWIGAFFVIPSTPNGLVAKELMVRISAYLLMGILVYLVITLTKLRRCLKRLMNNVEESEVHRAAWLLRITFDVKRALGAGTLRMVYDRVNKSKHVSLEAKNKLYEAMRRKRVDVPPPLAKKEKGKTSE